MSPLVTAVLELTDRVETAIDGGDWPRAQELETERRRLLEELAAGPRLKDEVESTFASLAERNHRLLGVVQYHRRRVLREAAVARSASDGAAAYAASPPPDKSA